MLPAPAHEIPSPSCPSPSPYLSRPPSRLVVFIARILDILQHICLNIAGIILICLCLPPALIVALGNETITKSTWSGHLAHWSWVASEYLGRLESRHLSTYLLGVDLMKSPPPPLPGQTQEVVTPSGEGRRDSAVFFS
ncbi:hypothetical protein A4X13_0g2281 [Tilletia indica]|uniref:Uncharacterized protein n=1 Tax=Tilletia indica TaxID=43049 RepID=A0A177THH2_9BASI|nr:hypothetical protein A4X13_0g2281 [Tilletia indica]